VNPTYSPQWHADNPLIENCNGTLLIDRTTTNTTIKLLPVDIRAAYNSKAITQIIQDAIGELKRIDYACLGATNNTTGAFLSLKSYVGNDTAYITLNSENYKIRLVIEEFIDVAVGELIILSRYE
jgi:hypothetical protein